MSITAHIRGSASSNSPFDGIEVRDRDLVLRTLESPDAAALFRLIDADRARLGRWLPWVEETRTEVDTVRFIADAADERRRRRSLVLGIVVDGALGGTLGLHYVDWFDRSAEIGYWVAARVEGRGYVTRATRRLVEVAFEAAGLHRLVIRCAIDNARSRRVAERLGFRREGVLREAQWVGGRFLDQHLFALLRREFMPEPPRPLRQ
jgi:ribosomal-protein-serine acetyltransferase